LTIDVNALLEAGLLAPPEQEHQIARQYRTMKRPLIKAAFESELVTKPMEGVSTRSIMVSSALPGDGKTFTSLNLALSLAKEQDYSILLVDGDVPKPHISRVLNAGEQDGLLDVLTDAGRPIESVIVPTTVEGLSFLPVGRRAESMTELLSSARMREVVQQLVSLDANMLVVVDSPPILLTSEARVLSSLFGQILMVVRAGFTPQQAVTESLEILGDEAPVSMVLNEAVHNSAANYYGYGYGYGYGDSA
jgi:exopolysaccharide/PEP-CTERM locus tyrosine autokinase